jgi:hypothetical protein
MFTNLNDESTSTTTASNNNTSSSVQTTTPTTENSNSPATITPLKTVTRTENTLYSTKCLFGSRYYDLQIIERINATKETALDYIMLKPLEKTNGTS